MLHHKPESGQQCPLSGVKPRGGESVKSMTTFSTRAVVKADDIDGCLPELLEHMEEHATVNLNDTGATIISPFGTVEICRRPDDLSLKLTAYSAEVLSMIKVFVAEHVVEFAGETASIVWSDAPDGQSIPPHFQKLVVIEAFDLSPRMRRVRFSCENVAAFTGNAGYHVRLLLPPAGKHPVWPSLDASGRMVWPTGDDALVSRVYTIRDVDVDNGQVDIDFVLHNDVPGPASAWAAKVLPGDTVGMLGPSGGQVAPADHYLVVGDETALPAISRLLRELPENSRGTAFIEVQDNEEIQQLTHPTNVSIHWLLRGAAAPGTTTLLQDAVRTIPKPSVQETCFVWVSCEFTACHTIRAYLRGNWDAPKGSYLATSYWRRGISDDGTSLTETRDDH
jgi:NADPH-dependent ferric siderophore reductase